MIKKSIETKPIVFPCTGCSGVERIASYLAAELEKKGLVEVVTENLTNDNYGDEMTEWLAFRKLVAIDSCSSSCSKRCLYKNTLIPAIHIQLNYNSDGKNAQTEFNKEQANQIVNKIESLLTGSINMHDVSYYYYYY